MSAGYGALWPPCQWPITPAAADPGRVTDDHRSFPNSCLGTTADPAPLAVAQAEVRIRAGDLADRARGALRPAMATENDPAGGRRALGAADRAARARDPISTI